MDIWIDADACPNPVKEIVFRAARRLELAVILVANQPVRTPPGGRVRSVVVSRELDAADDYIAEHADDGDLVVTADIPLAARLVERGLLVVNPRGETYTADNVRQKLAMRDFMETMRASGEVHGGPAAFGPRDRQAFANALDRLLRRQVQR